ncbi:hypothetical protein [Brevundimonas bullata]
MKSISQIDQERREAAASAAGPKAKRQQAIKEGLQILRLRYGPVFSGWADLTDIDLTQNKRSLFDQVVARQVERLPSLSDQRLCTVWWEFAEYFVKINREERSRRDWLFQQSLAEEWRRRTLAPHQSDASFQWPSTEASVGHLGLDIQMGPATGILAALGYRVGQAGAPLKQRRQILDFTFTEDLPPIDSAAYMRSWGEPNSGPRLQKLAESLAAFARNAKRREVYALKTAILQWQDDLQYLHDRYYIGHFGFNWPL